MKLTRCIFFLFLQIAPSVSFAGVAVSDLSVSEVLTNVSSIIQPFISLVLAISFCSGIFLIFRGLSMLKKFGMHINQMSQHGELGGPIIYVLIGAMLIYLPTSTDIVLQSIFGDADYVTNLSRADFESLGRGSELLGYAGVDPSDDLIRLADTLVLYIQFIGFVAFVRGWFMMSKAGQPGNQPGSISKGLTHIIGGILSINFVEFVKLINTTVTGG